MKIRVGFVSNSSSSSFVICKEGLTEVQIKGIARYLKEQHDDYDETYYNNLPKHFFGQLSYHVDPSIEEILNKLKVPLDRLEMGD